MGAAQRFARDEKMVGALLCSVNFDGTLDEGIIRDHGCEPGVLELALRRAEATIQLSQDEHNPNKYIVLVGFPDGSFIIGHRDDEATPQKLDWSLGTLKDLEQMFG